jgi:hypothetical protein
MAAATVAVCATFITLDPASAESPAAVHHSKKGDCVKCHRKETAGIVRVWKKSIHARTRVDCASCHSFNSAGAAEPVTSSVCGDCHEKQLKEHLASRHSVALVAGRGCTRNDPNRDVSKCRGCHVEGSERTPVVAQCARYLGQTDEVRQTGCDRCHQVQDTCASCHTNHSTTLAIVRDPDVCATCHMGPDHPQWEVWRTSKHGTLHRTAGLGATCQDCHMSRGTHNVSSAVVSVPLGKPGPKDTPAARRTAMVAVCKNCHAEGFARRELASGDAVRKQGEALVKKAAKIIGKVAAAGLLDPMPADRPAHPLAGKSLVLDKDIIYQDTSHIERLYFKMKKYDLAKMIVGVYHQNPAYAHWYGNAELKLGLIDIQAEARRLAEKKPAAMGKSALSRAERLLEQRLRELKKGFEDKEMSEQEYRRQKKLLLDNFRQKRD